MNHLEDRLIQLLKPALKRTIDRHPSLSYGLIEDTNVSEAHFIRQEAIKWEDVAEFHVNLLKNRNPGDEDIVLSRVLDLGHEHLWKYQTARPAWKILVIRQGSECSNNSLKFDIIFLCHHALGDGLSGAAFHKTLLHYLQDSSTLPSLDDEWPAIILPTIGKPFPVEQSLHFPSVDRTEITKDPSTNHTGSFSPWTGRAPSLPSIDTVRTLFHIVTIPEAQVKNILQTCRRLPATLTGLLHSLIIIYLSRALHDAQGFRAVTPYSMRRFTQLSPDEIANHISYLTTAFREPLLTAARQASNVTDEENVISQIANQVQTEITDELLRVPTEGSKALIEISRIKDLNRFCEDGMMSKRGYTYELSNIGAVQLPEDKTNEINLERLVFTQCAMVAGPAFGCSVVSVRGGPMTISLHWQEGIVDKKLMDGMRKFLERRLLGMMR